MFYVMPNRYVNSVETRIMTLLSVKASQHNFNWNIPKICCITARQ